MDFSRWCSQHLLDARAPLPLDAPFTRGQAQGWGVSRTQVDGLVQLGLVRRVLQGVYAAAQAPDDLEFRARAISLVVSPAAIVTDRTAAWMHGVPILPRSSHGAVPPIEVFDCSGNRVRRPGIVGGRRGLLPSDITEIGGVRVTTGVRSALDLGRLLWRFDALAALDGFLRIGVPHEVLLAEVGRFSGFRGVVQLRALAPLADGRAESPGESGLRLHWYDAGLPRPELQHWVYDDAGVGIYRLDMTLPEFRFAAEYDGQEFHTAGGDQDHDRSRREWLRSERSWHIEVLTKKEVYSMSHDPIPQLRLGFREARTNLSLWTPYSTRLQKRPLDALNRCKGDLSAD